MSATTHEVLVKARELIATPDRWVKEVSATSAHGREVYVQSPYAFCFCITGALDRASNGSGVIMDHATRLIKNANDIRGDVWRWNDVPARTHAEVLAAFDKAIALASSEASNA